MMDTNRPNKYATCSQCSHLFTVRDLLHPRGIRCPHVLQCGHSSCEQCIKMSLQNGDSIICAICNHKSTLKHQPGAFKKDFPLNMYLLGYFADRHWSNEPSDSKIVFLPAGSSVSGQKKAMKQKNEMKNDLCCECMSETADWGCHQCGVLYCNSCFNKVHKAAKALQKHTKFVLGTECLYTCLNLSTCKEHPEQKLEFHCKQCSQIICPYCVICTHSGHPVWTIREMNEAAVPAMKDAYDKANTVLKRLLKTQKEIKTLASGTDGSCNKGFGNDIITQTQRSISRHFVYLHGALQLLETSLLGRLEAASCEVTQNLSVVSSELDAYIDKVKQLLEAAQVAVDPANLPRSDITDITQKLLDTQQLPCHLVTETEIDDVETKFTVDQSFIDHLDTHCQLQIPSTKQYSLVSTQEMSPDAKVEPLDETPHETTSSSRASSVSCLSDTLLSDSGCATVNLPQTSIPGNVKGTCETVTVCHIKDPSSFYIHKESDRAALDDLCEQLSKYVVKGSKSPPVILKDGLYIVKFSVDGNWYRARVKSLLPSLADANQMADVLYIDYGNTEVVPVTRLRCMSSKHATIPPFAHHCSLFELMPPNGKWSQESIKTMAQMVDGRQVAMTVMGYSGNVYQVDLSSLPGEEDSDVPVSVRDAMVFLEMGCFVDTINPPMQIARSDKRYLRFENIIKGNIYDVLVSHIDTPTSFHVQKLGSHARYLTAVMEEMNQLYSDSNKKGMIYIQKKGMPCAAQYSADKKWYRAKVIDFGRKMVEVFYVDFGNQEVVNWTFIRKLHDKFLRLAPQAIHCSMTDVIPVNGNVWSPNAKTFLTEVTGRRVLKLFVDEVTKTQSMVTLYDSRDTVDVCLNALLVRKGHATSIGSSSSLVEYHKTGARVLANDVPKRLLPMKLPLKKQTRASRQLPNSSSNNSSPTVPAGDIITEAEPYHEAEGETDPFRLEVKVLSCVTPSCVYVALTNHETTISSMMGELQEYYSTLSSHSVQWKVNDKCCAFSNKDKMWYRAIIVELENDQAKVFLKDYALLDTLPVSNLQFLIPKFLNVRDGAIKCHLSGIKAAGDKTEWPGLACEFLTELVNQYDHLYITKKGDIENFSLPVELWVKEVIPGGPLDPTIEEWRTLNRKLVDQGLAIPVRSETESENVPSCQVLKELDEQSKIVGPISISECLSVPDKCINDESTVSNGDTSGSSEEDMDEEEEYQQSMTDWLPAVPINKTKFTAIATYVDDECCIYLHEIESQETLKVIQRALQCRLQSTQPKPHDLYWFAGQLCIAQYHDKNWYRGKVIEVNDDHTVKVFFVDYGNIEDCKATEMRKNVYMSYIPIQCHKYRLDGIIPASENGKWPIPVLDFVHATVVEKQCKITVNSNSPDEQPPRISLIAPGNIDLAELLVNMQYALYSTSEPPTHTVVNDQVTSTKDVASEKSILAEEAEQEMNRADDEIISKHIKEEQPRQWADCLSEEETKEAAAPEIDLLSSRSIYQTLNVDDFNDIVVEVTAILSPTEVVIHPINCGKNAELNREFEQLITQMQEEAPLQPILSFPYIGQPCCACYTEDAQWYRAAVLHVDSVTSQVKIQYVDYGNVEYVPMNEIHQLKSEWTQVPVQGLQCTLWQVRAPIIFSPNELLGKLTECLFQPPLVAKIKSRKPVLSVELLSQDSSVPVYQHLLESGLLIHDK